VASVVNRAWLFDSSLSTVIPSQMVIRIPLYELPALNATLGESLLNVGELVLGLTVIHVDEMLSETKLNKVVVTVSVKFNYD
jgi:hypothetical protein